MYFKNHELYQDYKKSRNQILIRPTRFGGILSMIFIPAGICLDYFIYPEMLPNFLRIRLFSSIITIIPLIMTYTAFGKKNIFFMGAIITAIACLSMSIMIALTGGGVASSYYVGLILIIIAVGSLLPWEFKESCVFCFFIFCMYLTACFINSDLINQKILFNNLYFTALAIIFCLVAAYLNSKQRFKEFCLRYEIENYKLKNALSNLEVIRKAKEDTEARLIHSEKMNSLGILAAGIMHEINNPLNFMATYIEMLRQQRYDTDAGFEEAVNCINDGLLRIKHITLNLGQFACIQKQDEQNFPLTEPLQNAITLTSHKIKKIRIIKDIDTTLLITGSKVNISLVFINLFLNSAYALKDVEKNPEIKISAYREHNRLFVKFRDNGTGIEPSQLPNVFDPFFTTKPTGHGMGMGLSISHTIIKNHQGNLLANSKKREWTEFVFDLPVFIYTPKGINL
jgi:two-component system, sensor histidine kinase PhcS